MILVSDRLFNTFNSKFLEWLERIKKLTQGSYCEMEGRQYESTMPFSIDKHQYLNNFILCSQFEFLKLYKIEKRAKFGPYLIKSETGVT